MKEKELATVRTPDFTLDIPDSRVRISHIQFFIIPKNRIAKLLWLLLRIEIKCTWYEETEDKGAIEKYEVNAL